MNKNAPVLSLLDQATELNKSLEQSYLGLAIVLVDIKEQELWKETGAESWVAYYTRELGRERSTISRLLDVGKWLKENEMLPPSNIGYQRLSAAIKAFPNKDPKYILSAASTLSMGEIMQEKTEAFYGADHTHIQKDERRYAKCECGYYFEV